jgi:hypothetical protein
MDDAQVHSRIEGLVAEEHRLLEQGEGEGLDAGAHARLEEVRVELDRYWDLLRQRRARAEAGLDPDRAGPRDEETVEDYLQ